MYKSQKAATRLGYSTRTTAYPQMRPRDLGKSLDAYRRAVNRSAWCALAVGWAELNVGWKALFLSTIRVRIQRVGKRDPLPVRALFNQVVPRIGGYTPRRGRLGELGGN
ncbi:hypothetical protein D9M68_670890 [compost metagenome]